MDRLLNFLNQGKSPYHVVANLVLEFREKGFIELNETEEWKMEPGKGYYLSRGGTSFIAFQLPKEEPKGYFITASHCDSPSFKIKENPEIVVEGEYIKLNTEKYGGSILSTWFDRPLSIAGRVVVKKEGRLQSIPVTIDEDLLIIPSVAIHMNREINKGIEYNPQIDLLPLYAIGKETGILKKQIARELGVEEEEILGQDLFLYVRQEAIYLGVNHDFIVSPRLDDLQCVYACKEAFLEGKSNENSFINVVTVFDNEEVGSSTRQGADSTFLDETLLRIAQSYTNKEEFYYRLLANSFLISADNAHGIHPNHPEKGDLTNRPYLNGGIVIKYHGNQKYTTDGMTGAKIKELCIEAKVPYQTYFNRSDIMGGSTLGNISTRHVSIPSADIGLAQLAMHSAVETAGSKDVEYAIEMMKLFYKGGNTR